MTHVFTTLVPLALGLAALALGATEDLGLADQGVNFFGLALVGVAVLKEGMSLRRDIRPVLARRSLRISVLAAGDKAVEAAELVQQLRGFGFLQVSLARDPGECHGQAVILFQPAPETAPALVAKVQDLAPDAHGLVYSHAMIRELRLSDRLTAANSLLRLLGDLGAIAEIKAAGL